jgi:hypothetical protein
MNSEDRRRKSIAVEDIPEVGEDSTDSVRSNGSERVSPHNSQKTPDKLFSKSGPWENATDPSKTSGDLPELNLQSQLIPVLRSPPSSTHSKQPVKENPLVPRFAPSCSSVLMKNLIAFLVSIC